MSTYSSRLKLTPQEFAIAATLNQNGRPVAFFSGTLQGAEIRHASIEKEAQAIIETIHHWKHYLTGRHFSIKTDQRSVAYMFNNKQRGKIKNDKIMRWRMELSCYSFNMVYRPGAENIAPDTFSRSFCAVVPAGLTEGLHHLLPKFEHIFVAVITFPPFLLFRYF